MLLRRSINIGLRNETGLGQMEVVGDLDKRFFSEWYRQKVGWIDD